MKHRSTERSGRWLRFVLAAIVLLVQAAVPMHALAMQRGGGDDVLALLNDPGVICHADPDADGRSDQMPGHAGDCVACGMCQLAASLPLLPTGAAVPAPRVAVYGLFVTAGHRIPHPAGARTTRHRLSLSRFVATLR